MSSDHPQYVTRRRWRYGDPLARIVPPSPPCPVVYDFGKCDMCRAAVRYDVPWRHIREISVGPNKMLFCQTHFEEEMTFRLKFPKPNKPTFKWDELEPITEPEQPPEPCLHLHTVVESRGSGDDVGEVLVCTDCCHDIAGMETIFCRGCGNPLGACGCEREVETEDRIDQYYQVHG